MRSTIFTTVQSLNQFKGKNIVISRGENTAIDWVNELETLANKVTVVCRGDEFKVEEVFLKKLEKSSAPIYKNTIGERIQKVFLKAEFNGTERFLKNDELMINYGFEKELTFIKEGKES